MRVKIKPLKRVGNKLIILDQTKLPAETVYLEIDDFREVIEAIKLMQVRGAPAIGIAAAYALALATQQKEELDITYLEKVGRAIKAARPTAVNLAWAVDRVLNRVRNDDSALVKGSTVFWQIAHEIHEEDRLLCDAIGKHGAELLNDGDTVLTHCNTGALATGGIGTALGVIYTAANQQKTLRVFADETRPLLQGARLTAWELQQNGIDCTLIIDGAAAMLMAQGKINHVIVGADRIAANGDVANKIGTYSLAIASKAHRVPFYVAAPYSTYDKNTFTGRDIIIEKRAAEEVTDGFGKRTAPDGIKVYNPAFDITPRACVSYYITDKGIEKGGR